jgi:hypothetical protein
MKRTLSRQFYDLNMSPKEKTNQLIEQFQTDVHSDVLSLEAAQECAKLLAVEVLFQVNSIDKKFNLGLDGTKTFWGSVINEIEKL